MHNLVRWCYYPWTSYELCVLSYFSKFRAVTSELITKVEVFHQLDTFQFFEIIEKQRTRSTETKESIFAKVHYIENSTEQQWIWINSNLAGIKSFAGQAEVFAAVVQRVKKLPKISGEIIQNIVDLFGKCEEEILELLFKEPWNANQMSSIKDVLTLRSFRPKEYNFNDVEKAKFFDYLEKSGAQDWNWMKTVPRAIHLYSYDAEILTSVLLKLKEIRKNDIDVLGEKYMNSEAAFTLKEEKLLKSVLLRLKHMGLDQIDSMLPSDLSSSDMKNSSEKGIILPRHLNLKENSDDLPSLSIQLSNATKEYLDDIIWTCHPASDFVKYEKLCSNNWLYKNINYVDGKKALCLLIFGMESLAGSPDFSKDFLSSLFSKAKSCLVLATNDSVETYKFQCSSIFEEFDDNVNSSLMEIMKMTNLNRPPTLKTLREEEKARIIQFIKESEKKQWQWIVEHPSQVLYFYDNVEVLAAVILKLRSLDISISFLKEHMDHGKNTILHKLSVQPLNSDQTSAVMEMLQEGVKPDHQNDQNKTFLALSPIKRKLSARIQAANDHWIMGLWKKANNPIQSWINLGDDDLLFFIFVRMSTYLSQGNVTRDQFFDPITIAREIWREKSNLPESSKQFFKLTAKYHYYDPLQLKRICKQSLEDDDKGNPDIALPVLNALKTFAASKPSFGYYIKEAFKSFIWISMIMRFIDGVTDISLTITYFLSMEEVIEDFLKETLCKMKSCPDKVNCLNSLNETYVMEDLCQSSDWNHKLVCTFPLMKWWIPGVLSATALAITYFAEVISSIVNSKLNNNEKNTTSPDKAVYEMKKEAHDHYLELCSQVCCQEHNQVTIFTYRCLLPLTQQISSLVYEHWVKSFVQYWKEKDKEMISLTKSLNFNKITGKLIK